MTSRFRKTLAALRPRRTKMGDTKPGEALMGADPPRFLLRQLSQWLTTHVPEPQADHQLLQRFVSPRDETAFAALLERHGPMVLWLCRRLLREAHQADDAFQATFLILARKAHSIRGAVGAWLHGVAYRVACRMRAAAR